MTSTTVDWTQASEMISRPVLGKYARFVENGIGVAQTATFGGLRLPVSGHRTAADQPNTTAGPRYNLSVGASQSHATKREFQS